MILVADNLNGLNPMIAQAMDELDPKPIAKLIKQCEDSGARVIDINPGRLAKRKQDRMRFLVETVQQATDMDLILDSPDPRLIEIGMSVCEKPPIVNAISLEEIKIKEILPMAVEYNTSLVILLMDEHSYNPASVEEKLAVAIELREKSLSAGMPSDKLIFDPVLPNLSWDDAFFRVAESIKTVRLLSSGAVFQEPALTMVGLSNLRSGLRRRYPWQIEETCLLMLAGAGLEYILADVTLKEFQNAFGQVGPLS